MEINLDEQFETLSKAPIVEAVIEIRAPAGSDFNETTARHLIEGKLKFYTYLDSLGKIELIARKDSPEFIQNIWEGVRFRSEDKKYIVQFNKAGFVFSRLEPYNGWNDFSIEGLRLWNLFQEIAKTENVNRLGLRFINRINLPVHDMNLSVYSKTAPGSPTLLGFPLTGFMHQNVFAVPGYAYLINVRQTPQAIHNAERQGLDLILDIDVFTSPGIPVSIPIEKRLREMRWLKNKVFFESITDTTKELLK